VSLQFLVIGAGKSGTTTLWAHLREHPEIWMPPSKEVPFFSDEGRYRRGLDWLMTRFFAEAPADAVLGKASPQYMGGKPALPPQLISERIRSCLPGVKLIAILRDPIDRAISDFRMNARMGREEQPFHRVAAELLEERALESARWAEPEAKSYLVEGEYGRILGPYLAAFPSEQVLVLFMEDLERDPARLLRRVFAFIGVDPSFIPTELDKRLLRGGSRQRLSPAEIRVLQEEMHDRVWGRGRQPTDDEREAFHRWLREEFSRLPPNALRELERALDRHVWVPGRPRIRNREAFYWWLQSEWNVLPDDARIEIPPPVRSALTAHYRRDGELLAGLLGIAPPWLESRVQTEAVAA
jgi:hypothetical protein